MGSQYLSASIWSIVTATSLLLVLLALGIYLWYRSRLKAAVEDASAVADLSARKDQLEAEIEQSLIWLENNREELLKRDAERIQQEKDRQELANLQTELAQKEQNVDELRRETSELQNVVSSLSKDRDRLESEKVDLEKKRDAANEKAKTAEEFKVQALIKTKEAQENLKDTKDELAIQQRFEDEAALKAQKYQREVDRLKSEETVLKDSIKSLEARLANLEAEIERHKGTGTKDEDVYGHLYDPPDIFIKAGLTSPHGEEYYTEEEALRGLKSYLDKCKLLFPTRVLNAFHTSLKIADISALAVMAGISGTGKSELPRRYAEALGMHFLLMAVQPRWDSPQDMFGFYNYIEQRYKATELAQSLVRMDKWNHPDKAEYADRMLLVLLDEMNLARVEYYFSEFLSKLEIRKSINPNNLGDRRKAEISLDVGSRIEGQVMLLVWLC